MCMAIAAENIALGVCDVTFATLDLGATKGGVEVAIETSTYEVTADQTGETPIKEVITGTTVTVTVPMLETNLTKLLDVMPQAIGIGAPGSEVGIEIRSGVNTDLLEVAGELKLHPTGLPASDTAQDFIAFKAAPVPNFTFRYATGEERVYEVTFKCYPDTTANNKIAAFGKPTAA
ncbi:hypothetical protein D3093_31225 (plasmid) [Azospirillum argentinense]|uniref:Phage tail protein n=3 Tax=Azospirillum TaxID=191 RepID=A0A4D8QDY2_AZOBR|nr:hypothetical protein D3093_31225 [Azospirillum argentinense]QCO06370.1 hypothetical protein D3867_31170 [Azospirillum argentinense]